MNESIIRKIEQYSTLYRTHQSSMVTIRSKIKLLEGELLCY